MIHRVSLIFCEKAISFFRGFKSLTQIRRKKSFYTHRTSELPVEIRTLDDSDTDRKFVFCQVLCCFSSTSFDDFIWTRNSKMFKIEPEKRKNDESEPLTVRISAAIIWHWFSLDTNMCIVYNQITTQNNRGAL